VLNPALGLDCKRWPSAATVLNLYRQRAIRVDRAAEQAGPGGCVHPGGRPLASAPRPHLDRRRRGRRTAPAGFPAVQQGKQLRLQVPHRHDLRADFTGLAADPRLQLTAGADPRTPRREDLAHIREGDLHRPQGADQAELSEHSLSEQAVAALAAADRLDQPFIAVEANRLDAEAGAVGHLADL
jgi:hypothetical protein